MAGVSTSFASDHPTAAIMQREASGEEPKDSAEILLQLPLCNASVVKDGKVGMMQQGDLVIVRASVSDVPPTPGSASDAASTEQVTDTEGRIVMLRVGTWVYPLSGQLARRSGPGVYVFPGAAAREFHCLRVSDDCADGDLAVLEAQLARGLQLVDSKTGQVVAPRDADAAVAVNSEAASRGMGAEQMLDEQQAVASAALRLAMHNGEGEDREDPEPERASAGGSGAGHGAGSKAEEEDPPVGKEQGMEEEPAGKGEGESSGAGAGAGHAGAGGSDDPEKEDGEEEGGSSSSVAAVASGWLAAVGTSLAAAREQCTVENATALYSKGRELAGSAVQTVQDNLTVDRVSGAISYSGKVAGRGLVVGAQYVGYGIGRLGTYVVGHSEGVEEGKEVKVSENTKRNLARARMATGAASTVASGVVVTAVEMARGLGRAVYKTVASTEKGKETIEAAGQSSTAQAAMQVGHASLLALGDVWDGMEEALRVVGKESARATETVVRHRYGEEAADAAHEGLAAGGDVGNGMLRLLRLDPVALATTAAVESSRDEEGKRVREGGESGEQGAGTGSEPSDLEKRLAAALDEEGRALAGNGEVSSGGAKPAL